MAQTESEILQYEDQLAQVRLASSALPEGPEKTNLDALEADLLELISLSKNSARQLSGAKKDDDPLSEEYRLFKLELGELTPENDDKRSDPETNCEMGSSELKEDFEGLQGMKCQAPFSHTWSSNVTYYNAFVSHVPEIEKFTEYGSVKVKVMFTNPTHKKMLPCPYYLEGKCRFSDEKCRYSHGEMVLLDSLKEYRDPDFSKLHKGCNVLAKQDDELWHRATVLSVNNTQCTVKFELNSKEEQLQLRGFENNFDETGLLNGLYKNKCYPCQEFKFDVVHSSDAYEKNISSDEENDIVTFDSERNNEELVKRILGAPSGSALGEWEKFTKGFGSRIMAKMGYIHGGGLGKNGMGRVEPVSAVILPTGKSLDHCMMLKEKAGNDADLFKAERRLKQIQKKHEEKLKKAYNNEKGKTDVFTFLNMTLHPKKVLESPKVKVVNETTRNLNVTGLQIAEELRRVEKEIKSLNQSLARHSPHSHPFNIIKEKIALKESKLSQLHASERRIMIEQNRRKDQQKLTEF